MRMREVYLLEGSVLCEKQHRTEAKTRSIVRTSINFLTVGKCIFPHSLLYTKPDKPENFFFSFSFYVFVQVNLAWFFLSRSKCRNFSYIHGMSFRSENSIRKLIERKKNWNPRNLSFWFIFLLLIVNYFIRSFIVKSINDWRGWI